MDAITLISIIGFLVTFAVALWMIEVCALDTQELVGKPGSPA